MGEHHLNIRAEEVLEVVIGNYGMKLWKISEIVNRQELSIKDFYKTYIDFFLFLKESKLYYVDKEDSSLIEVNDYHSRGTRALYEALLSYNDQA